MSAIKDFFRRKKIEAKFGMAGPGKSLNAPTAVDPGASKAGGHHDQTTKPTTSRPSSASSGAAEAALRRFEGSQVSKPNQKRNPSPLENILADERRKVLDEYKAKELAEESMAKKRMDEQSKEPEVEIPQLFTCNALNIHDSLPLKKLKDKIESQIRFIYREDLLLMSVLLIRNCNPLEQGDVCLSTLQLILSNLKTDDEEKFQKFSRIRQTKIKSKILDINGGLDLMAAVGFDCDEDGEWLVYANTEHSPEKIDYYLDVLQGAQRFPVELDREVVIKSERDIANASELNTLSDDFFKLNATEVTQLQKNLTEVREREQTLMTKAMRERGKRAKTNTNYTRVRVKLQSHLVEATFAIRENIGDLKNWLKTNFLPDVGNFTMISGRDVLADESKSFYELGFYPAVTFMIKREL